MLETSLDVLQPRLTGRSAEGGYVNFIMGDGYTPRLRATYGDNYACLVEVKTAYEPDSVLSSTPNIPPAQVSS